MLLSSMGIVSTTTNSSLDACHASRYKLCKHVLPKRLMNGRFIGSYDIALMLTGTGKQALNLLPSPNGI